MVSSLLAEHLQIERQAGLPLFKFTGAAQERLTDLLTRRRDLGLTFDEQAELDALADELGMRPLQAHCHLGLGTLYSQTEQSEQARAELSTAIDMYRDMEMTFWLPQAEATLAEWGGAMMDSMRCSIRL